MDPWTISGPLSMHDQHLEASMPSIISKYLIGRFVRDESGATSVEYTVMIAVIALGIITTLDDIGPAIVAILNNAAALLNAV